MKFKLLSMLHISGAGAATLPAAAITPSSGARTILSYNVAMFSSDLTASAATARRLDVSATIRAFTVFIVFVASIAFMMQYFGEFEKLRELDLNFGFSPELFASIVNGALTIFAVSSPILMILIDWMSRQPMRTVSGILAAFSGIAVLITGGYSLVIVASIAFALLSGNPHYLAGRVGSVSPIQIILIASWLWLALRAFRVELALAGKQPREILLGFIHRPNIFKRFAFLLGLPSSMWRWSALFQIATWLFLLSRPIFYVGMVALAGLIGLVPELRASIKADVLAWGGAVFILAGHCAFLIGKRLAARRIWGPDKNFAQDEEPILFLRSFKDDQLRFRRTLFDLPGKWLDLWSFRRNVDELLVDEFAQFGPVIALGNPDDNTPRFGAQRRFLSDEDWQQAITREAKRSQLIVISAGNTAGLMWEYRMLQQTGLLAKTIFLFPPSSRKSARTAASLKLFSEAFSEIALGNFDSNRQSLIAVAPALGGEGVWTAKKPSAQAYLVALRRYFYAAKLGR